MSVAEIAKGLTELCKAGQYAEAMETYYAPNIVSVEAMGPEPKMEGLAAVRGKMAGMAEYMEIHGIAVDGPFVNSNTNTFGVEFILDGTVKHNNEHVKMREVAVYTVEGDKIVHEQFLSYVG